MRTSTELDCILKKENIAWLSRLKKLSTLKRVRPIKEMKRFV